MWLAVQPSHGDGDPPGFYGDNSGTFTASFTVSPVPEPGSLFLGGAGLAGLLAAQCRPGRTRNRKLEA